MMRSMIYGVLWALLVGSAVAQPSVTSTPSGLVTPILGPQPLGNGPSLDLNFVNGAPIDPRITFTRASIATYFDAAGSIQSAAVNTPRIDYDPVTHAVRGLLIEEARTNLLLNSATLATQSVTTTAVAYTLSFYDTGSVALSGSCAGSLAGTGAFPARVALTFIATAGTCTVTVTGSVLNGQVEAGSFRTSWISTAGASATRAADVATMPGGGAWLSQTVGTLAADGIVPTLFSTLPSAIAAVNDGGSLNNFIELRTSSGHTVFASNALIGGVSITALDNAVFGVIAIGTPFKVALSYKSGGSSTFANGAIGNTATTAFSSGAFTTLTIGNSSISARPMNGYIRRIRYWPRALSAGELQQVTT